MFSFADTRIRAYGLATSHAYEAPKPEEFGQAGRNWDEIGWRVDVEYREIPTVFRPADWMELLRPLLPGKYAPLLADGRGSQSIYLTQLPELFALQLAELLGKDVAATARVEAGFERPEHASSPRPETVLWEEHLRSRIESDSLLTSTDKEALIIARRGQGLFRERVQQIEQACRITGVTRPEHLRASHCKPWRDASNEERLDGNNGLLLTPSIDHLFDRGFISFKDDGALLVSPVAHTASLAKMGVPTATAFQTGTFRAEQAAYLEYHRDQVFLASRARLAG